MDWDPRPRRFYTGDTLMAPVHEAGSIQEDDGVTFTPGFFIRG